MTALIVVGAIVLFFVFLLSLRGVITISYSDELSLTVRVLFVKIKILPKKEKKKGPHSMSARRAERIRKKKEEKDKRKRKKKAEKQSLKDAHRKPKEKKNISDILDTVSLITELVGAVVRRFAKRLRIKIARFNITVASDDAATTAIAYGAITQSINILLPILSDVKNFDLPRTPRQFDVRADFTADTPSADIKISFSLRVWHLLDIAAEGLKKFISHKIKKTDKQ